MINLDKTPTTDIEQYVMCAIKHARKEIESERRHRQAHSETRNFRFIQIARRERRTAHVYHIVWRSRILSELRGVKVWLGGYHGFNAKSLNH